MSKRALQLLIENAFNKSDSRSQNCHYRTDIGVEDVEIGRCLEAVDVYAGDSRDELGRTRFLPFEPRYFMNPNSYDRSFWYWKYLFYYPKKVYLEANLSVFLTIANIFFV